jgi:hypothetical protein
MTNQSLTPEFSRPVTVARLGARPIVDTLVANPDELQRLAVRLGLVAITRLAALVRVHRQPKSDLIHVEGRLEADIVQTCIVTLIDFPSHVEDSFALDFSSEPFPTGPTVEVDPEADPPEPIENGIIDLGELVAQYLSLALDPYPRAPGAELGLTEVGLGDPEAKELPFGSLRNLKLQS